MCQVIIFMETNYPPSVPLGAQKSSGCNREKYTQSPNKVDVYATNMRQNKTKITIIPPKLQCY